MIDGRACRLNALLWSTLFGILAVWAGCQRSESPAPVAAEKTPVPNNSELAADVDLTHVTLGEVRARIGDQPATPDAIASALVRATIDKLVLREAAVLKLRPLPGESDAKASERVLDAIFSPDRHCGGIGDRELRLAFVQRLADFKHPASWTVWTALVSDATQAKRLHERLVARLPTPPDLPSVATCTLAKSPVVASHGGVFEQVVAELAGASTATQLRRYTFFDQGDAEFGAGRFRGTDPAVATAAKKLRIGQLSGVIGGSEGHHVALLVAREPRRNRVVGDAWVQDELRAQLCGGAAKQARAEYVQRLVQGATVKWHRDVLRRAFGDEAVSKLPKTRAVARLPVLP